ncbi:MAG: MFS transporter [Actinomycetales bacterium]|nr:MAG: MFS transporter [Actinomycetales bacterium]
MTPPERSTHKDHLVPDEVLGEPDIYHDSPGKTTSTAEYRRVAMATGIGTMIEWYDFFIYAFVAALLFGQLFFSGLGEWSQLASLATIGVSFFFRPLGAVAMGHIGDRYGRRVVLILTLVLMGGATTCVGLLPTTASLGMAAPILLIALRCLQGFSAGGEWGGAAMLSVEHAPHGRRGRFGASPQVGVPAGMLLASGVLALLTNLLTTDQFEDWGWRLPFIFSLVLIFLGQWIRRRVSESPVFAELKEAKAQTKAPMKEVFAKNRRKVSHMAIIFMGNNAFGYMLVGGFLVAHVTKKFDIPRATVLPWILAAAGLWIATTIGAAILSDKLGRKRVFVYGYALQALIVFPVFLIINQGELPGIVLAYFLMTIPLGLTYGPLPALYAEEFPPHIRLSGVSIAYAIGSVLGGAFAPTIAEFLTKETGTVVTVAYYLAAMSLLSFVGSLFLTDRTNQPLHTMTGH